MGDVHSRRLQLGSQIPRQEWEGDGGQDVAFFGIYIYSSLAHLIC